MEVQSLPLLESVENPLNGCSSNAATKDQLSELSLQLKEEVEVKSASIMHVSQLVGKTVSKGFDVGRRVSARLQKKEKPFYGNQKAKAGAAAAAGASVDKTSSSKKRARLDAKPMSRITSSFDDINKKRARMNMKLASQASSLCDEAATRVGEGCDSTDVVNVGVKEVGLEGVASEEGVVSDSMTGKSAHARVKDTLRIFNNYYLHFAREEEQRCKRVEVDEKKTSKGPKCKGANAQDIKRSAKRPDLKAISKMMETRSVLYPTKQLGPLPGIDVGHQFFSRAEMVALGFHSHWLNGIDFMGGGYSKMEEYKDYTFPVAVSIVMSGMYEDDLDNSEDIVYTGQGGHNLLGDKRQIKDQVMERGNLALKNNMVQSLPVRVIRGHESVNSYCGKVYTYDGLYKVVKYWAELGVSGFTVFKYRLTRLEGQPILTTNQVHFSRAQAPKSLLELRGLVCKDISGGQENIPIPATNVVDDPPSVQVSEGVKLPMDAPGCKCKGYCVGPNTCACARLNGSDFPYVHRDGGRLVKAKDVVFECGPNCGCGPDCINRISQKDMKYRLEVFRTPKKGWAVRSWDSIPSGAPICEYTGIIRRTDELDYVFENNFIFDIDCLQTMKGLDGRERRLGDVLLHADALGKTDEKKLDVPEFCIDAGSVGNIARFINHSCEPNLFVQCVLSSHHDIKLARILLFAADNIPPLQELTYDYGYALDSVTGPDGTIKKMPCYCGAAGCRKRLS
ncbi:histone-lysine N-methyltransferase, H3 lysine-9 specific SUVH4 isoform X2 [Cinnamomum micranthum f. kanehirae]|uniref:Histone-lysine N-methyltransferase, H3 lysine-9 specific SUVH4 isoform X2 n=1 Tax=Cinnamomum micranthum f. kanehirae TaxID=337451 RepID=A0A3S3NBT0_9MAGN|nr:histone-lysine N-methyltransferase, H3 lysine-9 specific SUVH4 isoform X2 [Cinnamomum micranthum f. kanehirae]